MSRRVALILAAVTVGGTLAGCDGAVGARLTFEDTETVKITEIVLSGRHSDVRITGSETATETTIRRIITGDSDPGTTYQRKDGVLTLTSDCGPDCGVDYEITAPASVAVRGELTSGDVGLIGVGPVDIRLTSGDVMVDHGTGPLKVRATSGDLNVVGRSEVTLEAQSGDLSVLNAAGPVTVRTTSGDIDVELAEASSVTAAATNGDVQVMVPAGAYQVRTGSASGDQEAVGVTNDPKSTNVLDVHTRNGDVSVIGG
ncbi:hypothetical protein Aca07nite_17980 [Actinoplanes capillaceus]|uniref:DUF4097 domain-containing protein n=1 Tax=Actinoplanes campanulatus TaxID=113559 RepID=A0ABQ3WGG2_9ACTN|nr:DUF4097 family beta strand repeat-containing protein [Actinoplanes capillaceus]GID44523.1 hypothetical protein Aca07nite_17980 [Actinoplanes capillaceus]